MIKPEDVTKVTGPEHERLTLAEGDIDKQIKDSWDGKRALAYPESIKSLQVDKSLTYNRRGILIDILLTDYRKHWDVQEHSNQQDGSWWEFRPKQEHVDQRDVNLRNPSYGD